MGTTDEGCKSLYVGNLDPRVTDNMLHEIFGVAGSVNNTKIIPDKNVSWPIITTGQYEYKDRGGFWLKLILDQIGKIAF